MYERLGKRVVDVLVSSIALVLLAVPLLVIAAGIRATMGSPVLFRQTRSGRNGAHFEVLKFRTMRDARPGEVVSSAERITKLGRLLRSTSLDELPQLVNVLRGDMSLVGPRPLLTSYDALYSPQQARRLEARPGITGLAQVSGRSKLSWAEKFSYDVEYVDSIGFWGDVAILVSTTRTLADRSATTAADGSIQERFDGSN